MSSGSQSTNHGPNSSSWKGAAEHPREAERVAALHETGLAGHAPDPICEAAAWHASAICGTPISAVSLVDSNRQWFTAMHGLPVRETPREVAFCAHAILQDVPFIIPDATKDERFTRNPLVTGAHGIRFYAGVPLFTDDRLPLGSLCVMDTQPRTLDARQVESLKSLATLVAAQLQTQRRSRMMVAAQRAQEEITERLRKIASRVPGMLYQFRKRPDGTTCFPYASEGIRALVNLTPEQVREDATAVFATVHADDVPELMASIEQSDRTLSEWRFEYRLHHADGTLHWMLGNSVPERETDGGTLWHGCLTDITQTKHTELKLSKAEASAARLAEIAKRTSNGVIITDPNGRIEWVNEGFTRISGYTLEEVKGRTPGSFLQSPISDDDAINNMRHAVATGTPISTEIVNRHKDGKPYTVSIEITPLRDTKGTLTGFMAIETDITEERAAAEVLRVDRERLNMATTSAKMGLWDWNPKTGAVHFDRRWAEMLGYDLSELTPHERECTDRMHPEDLPRNLKAIEETLRDNTPYSSEHRMRHRDGTWRWVLDQGRVVSRDAQGEVTRVVGSQMDISERKRTELELSRATALLEKTGELALVGGWDMDLATMKLTWTLETFRIAEIEPPIEPDLETGMNLFAPEARPLIAAAVQAAMENGTPYDLEVPLITAKGRHRWVKTQGYAEMHNGKAVRLYGTFQDVTQSRLARMELLEITERFKLATRAGGVGTWDLQLPEQKLTWDEQMFRLYGTTREQFTGEYEAWKARIHLEDRARWHREIDQALRGEKPFDTEFRIVWPDGSTRYIRGIAIVQHDEAERAVRMVGTNWDVTAQKRSEERIKEANSQLEVAARAAEAANRAKSAFLANMSHEIRTPLTAILGFADLLRDEDNITTSHEQRVQAVDTIRMAGTHLLSLINDILDLSKIEAEKMTVERIDMALPDLLEEVVSLLKPKAIGKGLALDVSFASPVPARIMSDPTRLRQILMNLVGNAVKFTEAGSVSIVVGAQESDGTARLIIDVADTGPGMSPAQTESLFRVFGQGDESVTRRYGGTGLGLTVSKRLATLMSGDIMLLRTEPGKGSCFRLVLPLTAAPNVTMVAQLEETQKLTVTDVAPTKLVGRILLAEDGIDNQRLIAFHLRKAGATVEVADNGLIALEKLDKAQAEGTPFDLLVTDIQMPEMDGQTLTRTLRDRGSTLPIIILTAHAMAEHHDACLEAGCNGYATKPIDKVRLIAVCAQWMNKGQGV